MSIYTHGREERYIGITRWTGGDTPKDAGGYRQAMQNEMYRAWVGHFMREQVDEWRRYWREIRLESSLSALGWTRGAPYTQKATTDTTKGPKP